ncbi:MAG: amidohydrolase [Clostridia bacterium]|nr:amidohydrolase [Clostridia bacterium]
MKKIYCNANVITMEKDAMHADAFIVEDGLFAGVGTFDEMKALAPDAEIEDMGGKTITPGFFETHMHHLSEGLILRDINHNDCHSIQELIEHSRKHLETHDIPEGRWVRGRGWNQDKFTDEKRFITRDDLDKISTTVPLAFTRTCGHVIVCNTKALEIMGMSEHADDVPGGVIDRDETGRPLGIFRENARSCVLSAIPEETLEGVKELIYLCQQKALACGIVEIQSDEFKDVPGNFGKVVQAFNELIEEDKLKVRVYEQCNLPVMEWLDDFLAQGYHTGWQNTEKFTIGPFKVLIDGALGARTALMRDKYADGDTYGVQMLTADELNALVDKAYSHGMQIACHAIGDKGMDLIMDAIEYARSRNPKTPGRDGIIHCQIMNPDQYDRMKAMDLIGYIQPIFLNYDYQIIDTRVGEEKGKTSYGWKTMLDMGIAACGGSDCPVEDLAIIPNIHCAVTRKSNDLKPEGGYHPEQNLTVEQALSLFTTQAAYASFREDWAGSIKAGKHADFVVLDKDIMSCEPDDILNAKVLKTYIKGSCEYEA